MLLGGVFRGAGELAIKNPATGALLAQVPNGGAAEATDAVEIASRAQKIWAALTAKQRAAILRKWFELIMATHEDLAQIMTAEQGKPLAERAARSPMPHSFVNSMPRRPNASMARPFPRPCRTRASSSRSSPSASALRSRPGTSRPR